MSFRCENCGDDHPRLVPTNDAPIATPAQPERIVIETRPVDYMPRWRDGEFGPIMVDRGGAGTEIVREALVCKPCAAFWHRFGKLPKGAAPVTAPVVLTPAEQGAIVAGVFAR